MAILIQVYDEPQMLRALSTLDLIDRTAFAAACAEALLPLLEAYADRFDQIHIAELGRESLSELWNFIENLGRVESIAATREALVLPENSEQYPYVAYAENAVAAIAYTARTAVEGKAQDAVWAARQICEAADLAALELNPLLDLNDPDAETVLGSSAVVQNCLSAIERYLRSAKGSDLGRSELRATASEDGNAWLSLFIPTAPPEIL